MTHNMAKLFATVSLTSVLSWAMTEAFLGVYTFIEIVFFSSLLVITCEDKFKLFK